MTLMRWGERTSKRGSMVDTEGMLFVERPLQEPRVVAIPSGMKREEGWEKVCNKPDPPVDIAT